MAETVANITAVALIASAFVVTAVMAIVASERERNMVRRAIPVKAETRRHPRG